MKLSRGDALRFAGMAGWIVGAAFVVASATSSPPAHAMTYAYLALSIGFGLVAAGEWMNGKSRRAALNGVSASFWVVALAVSFGAPLWPSVGVLAALMVLSVYLIWSDIRSGRNGSTS